MTTPANLTPTGPGVYPAADRPWAPGKAVRTVAARKGFTIEQALSGEVPGFPVPAPAPWAPIKCPVPSRFIARGR